MEKEAIKLVEGGLAERFSPQPPQADDDKPEKQVIHLPDAVTEYRFGPAATDADLAVKASRAAKAVAADTPQVWTALAGQGVHRGRGEPGKVAFLFPGQGSQYPDMGSGLARAFPRVLDAWEKMDEAFGADGERLSGVVYPNPAFSREKERFASDPDAAKDLLQSSDNESGDADLAALTMVASTILNLNETITKQ